MKTLLILGLLLAAPAFAQEPTPAPTAPKAEPTLSDVQKLQILNAAKDVEIGELRVAQARAALQQLLAAFTPAGYQLTEKLELVKSPEPKK